MFIPLIFPRCLSPSCVYSCPHSIRHVSHFHTLNKALFFVTLSRFSCPLGPTTTTLARAHCHANATTERERDFYSRLIVDKSVWIRESLQALNSILCCTGSTVWFMRNIMLYSLKIKVIFLKRHWNLAYTNSLPYGLRWNSAGYNVCECHF